MKVLGQNLTIKCKPTLETTAIVTACILERSGHINSAGGYLRALTEKARGGEFFVGPMLMTTLKTNWETAHRKSGNGAQI